MLFWLLNLHILLVTALDSGYGYQTGQLSINDSEITILINSTFEIIEDFENDNETEILSITPPKPSKIKLPVRMNKLRPSTCQKYSEAQKYQLLEAAGGRNQFFMADSVDEAAQNFAASYPDTPFSASLGDAVNLETISTSTCDSRCEMIKSALNLEISRRNSTAPKRAPTRFSAVLNDAPPTSACSLGNFIPVGVCSDLGEPVDGGTHESLCSACRGLYMLGVGCFPKIFNTVQCNSQEMGCIFDTFTDMAHGQCDVQTLSFKVLRNNGDENCEDWIVEQIQLPVACQCSLSKSSFLRAKPIKEL